MRSIATPGDEKTIFAPHFCLAKNTQKQSYILVVVSKLAQAPKHLWTQMVYKSQKLQATKPNIMSKN